MKAGTPKIYKVGEDILVQAAEPVHEEEFNTTELTQIVEELNAIAKEIGAVGFAAPQIGYSKRVMTIGMTFNNPRRPNVQQFPNMTFINPELLSISEETAEDWEGCASFDMTLALVQRPVTIQYQAYRTDGTPFKGELKNFPARVFQHELDHLNGILMDSKAIETKEFDKERDVIISLKS